MLVVDCQLTAPVVAIQNINETAVGTKAKNLGRRKDDRVDQNEEWAAACTSQTAALTMFSLTTAMGWHLEDKATETVLIPFDSEVYLPL